MKQLKHTFLRGMLLAFALVTIPAILFAQNVQVKGKITDAVTKAPVQGASVTVKNSTTATATNAGGEFV